jgi:hypothetical protein
VWKPGFEQRRHGYHGFCLGFGHGDVALASAAAIVERVIRAQFFAPS